MLNSNKNNCGILWAFMLYICMTSCREEHPLKPLTTGEKPAPISEVLSESLPGAIKFSFKKPLSKDFLYTKATFESRPGVEKTVKVSQYEDTLLVNGFEKAGEHSVTFYAVAKGEVSSDAITVKAEVLEPPYISVFKSLKVYDDFGGMTVSFENLANVGVSINLLMYDELKRRLETKHVHYTETTEGNFRLAGFEPVPIDIHLFVSDRWGNISDTIKVTVHPMQEFLMSKARFKSHPLPPGNNVGYDSYTIIERLWDGNIGEFYYGRSGYMGTFGAIPGHSFCFDIGVKAKLSRIKMHHPSHVARAWYHAFANYAPRLFEFYGSNDPNPDGSWDSWTKISDFVSTKPNGMTDLELRQFSTVDGEDFFIPFTTGAYRYYRWKTMANWGGHTWLGIDEITLWGFEE